MKFQTLSIVFSVSIKTIKAKNAKFSVFVIYVEAVLYLLLHSLHDFTITLSNFLILLFWYSFGSLKCQR